MRPAVVLSQRKQMTDWLFWSGWVAASTLAILVGFAAAYALIILAKVIAPGTNEDRLMGVLLFPVLALALGVFQWLVLRKRIPKAGWWILATAAGLSGGVGAAGGLSWGISAISGRRWGADSMASLLVLYGLAGLGLGLVQLLVLRPRLRWMALWLLANVAGCLALGLIIGPTIDRVSDIVALGAVPAAFSGFGLVGVLRKPPATTTPPRRPDGVLSNLQGS